MIRRTQRFRNHLDDNLIHLRKNLFISPADPLYYEKVIRYLDATSPEAHYKIGQKFQRKGNYKRAIFHYKEVLRTYPSPFYSAANRAIRHIEEEQAAHALNMQNAFPEETKRMLPQFMKTLLIVLLVLNLLLVVLFAGNQPLYKTISSMKVWGVGSDVTYETVDAPFIMYIAPETSSEAIELALHKQALELAKEMPKTNILIYGVLSQDNGSIGKTMLLRDEELTKSAIVVAQYHPETDDRVRIRFLNAEFEKHQPLSAFGANLVRTALEAYIKDNGSPPDRLEALLQDYPNNYLSFIPLEAATGSNGVSAAFTGKGGWVYTPGAADLAQMFYANSEAVANMTYEPVHIEINKDEHQLKLVSGQYILWDKEIGLGANDRTPQGHFQVIDRVQNPQGSHAQSYGEAGLGLGGIALHGTYDESSIGSDKSLGCVRLTNGDVQQLFPFVPKGAEVQIQATAQAANNQEQVKDADRLIPSARPALDESPEGVVFHWLG
ncbi:L,D-transpeptidase family protein [Paenibacillus aceris]|uniref:Tetratricopeptide (TPR) repeat protein n=1 Tax=Paenibacillus aceris TaxID=869555 RepID=A0ABS4HTV1_9BACL|nr:L,D-transpeptidase family protein [Paenibacillus aceris]MBP1961671.1 tetratricopeptide (TPR) repeat protein [Paenibacillus aceris]NHW34466.1 L,D-transpeptidase family protein [Paenibacillus aceris]